MTVISRPVSINFSGNLPPFRIRAYSDVTFVLSSEGTELLRQKYVPDSDDLIVIDLRPVIEDSLSFVLQDGSVPYVQPSLMKEFTAEIDGDSYSFTVLRGGIDRLSDLPADYLRTHFLTWQPHLKEVAYSSPEFLTYYAAVDSEVKVRGYRVNASGAVVQGEVFRLASLTAGSVWTFSVQYAYVAGVIGGDLPAYYDVWIEASGVAQTGVMRYVADGRKSLDEDWILFENSLGGIDCFRAYGKLDLAYRHGHKVGVREEEMTEYDVDTERLYKKDTGVLDRRQAMWLTDFFPSRGKYISSGGSVRRIVVTDSSVSGGLRREPLSFGFTFRFAEVRPYLNLPDMEVPADMLDVSVPDLGSFLLPPRLSEFPRIEPGEGVLIPAQQSWDDSWGVIPWSYFRELLEEIAGGGFLTKDRDSETPHSLSVGGQLLARLVIGINGLQAGMPYVRGKSGAFISGEGRADLESAFIRDYLSSVLFREGFFGEGFKLWNDNGIWKMNVDQLTVRQIMRVYELLINRIRAVGGTLAVTAASGKIKSVADDGYNYRITFEKDNDAFVMHDLIRMQRWTGSDVASGGDGLVVKGYWVEVNGCGYNADKEQWVTVSKNDEGLWAVPSVGDEVVQMGNTTDATRQGVIVISATEGEVPKIEILGGVDRRSFEGRLKVRLGGLDDITDADFPDDDQPSGDGLYGSNVYLKGRFVMANGQDVMTYFTIQEGLFRSVIGNAAGSVMTSRDNYLANAGFAQSLDGWQVATGVIYFTDAEGNWLFANGGMLSHVSRDVEIGDHLGIPTLHIVNGSVCQRNADMQRHPLPVTNLAGNKEAVPVWLTFHYKANTAGTIKIYIVGEDTEGFETFTPFGVERSLTASEDYALFSYSGYWSGTGDFVLSYDGDINIYGLTLWSDNEAKYATLIEQTESHILLEAQARTALGVRVASLEVTADKITAYVGDGTMASAVTQTVSGLDIMASKVVISGSGNNKVYLDSKLADMQSSTTQLGEYIDDAFRDSVLSESEANEISRYLLTLQLTKQGIDSQYSQLHANLNALTDNGDTNVAIYAGMISAHSALTASKGTLDTAYTSLVSSINAAVTAYGNLSDWAYDDTRTEQQNESDKAALESAASTAYTSMTSAFGTFKTALGGFTTAVEQANLSIDRYHEAYSDAAIASIGYLKAAMDETTIVSGGLVLTTAVVLGRKVSGSYTAYAGMSGLYDTNKAGNGIAFWAGGEMGDTQHQSDYSGITRWAQTVIRMDGSGYLAGGRLSWDASGNVSVGSDSVFLVNGHWTTTTYLTPAKLRVRGSFYERYVEESLTFETFRSRDFVVKPDEDDFVVISQSNPSSAMRALVVGGKTYLDGDVRITGDLTVDGTYPGSGGTGGHSFNANQFSIDQQTNTVSLASSFAVSGTITAYDFALTSDRRLKDIIGQIRLSVADIAKASSILYKRIDGGDDIVRGGVIAQEWLETASWAVRERDDGYYSVAEIPLAMASVIACAREIVRLWAHVEKLEGRCA